MATTTTKMGTKTTAEGEGEDDGDDDDKDDGTKTKTKTTVEGKEEDNGEEDDGKEDDRDEEDDGDLRQQKMRVRKATSIISLMNLSLSTYKVLELGSESHSHVEFLHVSSYVKIVFFNFTFDFDR